MSSPNSRRTMASPWRRGPAPLLLGALCVLSAPRSARGRSWDEVVDLSAIIDPYNEYQLGKLAAFDLYRNSAETWLEDDIWPSKSPSSVPTDYPTGTPTIAPTGTPSTAKPTFGPTYAPTPRPTPQPTTGPTISLPPTPKPTGTPTRKPTPAPTVDWAIAATNAVPDAVNRPPGYFNYDPSSSFGPRNWRAVQNSQERRYWEEFSQYIRRDLDDNECGSGSKDQSPVDVRKEYAWGECLQYHEFRHKQGIYLMRDYQLTKEILPTKLRLKFPRRPPGQPEEPYIPGPPSADVPKGWGHQLDVVHVDFKTPSEHWMEGKQYAGEYQVYLLQKKGRGVPAVSVLMDYHPRDEDNAALQVALDAFQLQWNQDRSQCGLSGGKWGTGKEDPWAAPNSGWQTQQQQQQQQTVPAPAPQTVTVPAPRPTAPSAGGADAATGGGGGGEEEKCWWNCDGEFDDDWWNGRKLLRRLLWGGKGEDKEEEKAEETRAEEVQAKEETMAATTEAEAEEEVADYANATLASQRLLQKRGTIRPDLPWDVWHKDLIPTHWFFGYEGSLTEPPCAEFLEWHVFTKPMLISRRQHRQLREMIADQVDPDRGCQRTGVHYHGSVARPPQPLRNRTLYKCNCRDFIPDDKRKQYGRNRCEEGDEYIFHPGEFANPLTGTVRSANLP